MANTNIELVGLDFASLKSNLKTFLKNNTQFKDLDYEGSNINVLLDVLAYNTYLNAFYTNMVASEMFLDTAQLRDSVVSHAKELNYVPRSFSASRARVKINIVPTTTVPSISVPAYTSFTSRVGSNTYTFTTGEAYVITTSNNGVYSLTTDIYEGNILTDTFVISNATTRQRFVLSSSTVDINSIAVTVYEDSGQTTQIYTRATKLVGLSDQSKVFFVQPAENQQYEIVFGDDVFGRKPKDGSTAVVRYRACSGELPNGASTFVTDGLIDGHANVAVSVISSAAGGSVAETVESIRFNAPRAFQAQDRAITTADYETILSTNFTDIQAISVYGGEELDPPQYGRVFISVDVANADGASAGRKQVFYDFIKDKTPLTIQPVFIDPAFLYLRINSTVYYDVNITTKSTSDIKSDVQAAISTYQVANLDNFKTTMYYSTLAASIDNADQSIVGNDTEVFLLARVNPALNVTQQFVIQTHNALAQETGVKLTADEPHYGHTITSTQVTYQNTPCIIVDDTLGKLYIASLQSGTIELLTQIGTVNYQTGLVTVASLNISDYDGAYVEFRFRTLSKNVRCVQNTILTIDDNDVNVTVVGVKI